jgi:hypothetical protein
LTAFPAGGQFAFHHLPIRLDRVGMLNYPGLRRLRLATTMTWRWIANHLATGLWRLAAKTLAAGESLNSSCVKTLVKA